MRRTLEPEVMDTAQDAEEYDAMNFSEPDTRFAAAAAALLGDPRGARALDIGTGTAKIPVLLLAQRPDISVLAVDMADQMLRLAGRMCDGTALWMAGPKYIEEVVVPELGRGASEAGRPTPRIIAGVPIVVTNDVAAARERIATAYAGYGTLPSYQRAIYGSGASGPADLAVIGTEEQVESQLRRWRDAGVTDFYAAVDGQDAEVRAHTRAFLKSLLPAI